MTKRGAAELLALGLQTSREEALRKYRELYSDYQIRLANRKFLKCA